MFALFAKSTLAKLRKSCKQIILSGYNMRDTFSARLTRLEELLEEILRRLPSTPMPVSDRLEIERIIQAGPDALLQKKKGVRRDCQDNHKQCRPLLP